MGDYVAWNPLNVLENVEVPTEPWHKIAAALLLEAPEVLERFGPAFQAKVLPLVETGRKDQSPLEAALAEARAVYSPVGFRIVEGGYAPYLEPGGLSNIAPR
jgi:hypothetical protein